MDESEHIKLARKGDLESFNALVHLHQDAMFNLAYRIMGDQHAAADATQEAVISAYKAIGRFRGGAIKSWLMRIVTNACYDELRRRKRRPQSSLDEMTDEYENSPMLVGHDIPNPESELSRMELMQAVKRCLDRLPDEQRMATVLSDVEGYDYREIADIMSTSLGTVKSRLSRARVRMRDCLRKSGELLPGKYRLDTR